jgi:hypothetical protein
MLVKIPVRRDSDISVRGEGILSGKRYHNPPYVKIAERRMYGSFYGYGEGYAGGWAIEIFGKKYPLLLEKGSFFFPQLPREGEYIAIEAKRLGLIKETIEMQSDPEFSNHFVRFP